MAPRSHQAIGIAPVTHHDTDLGGQVSALNGIDNGLEVGTAPGDENAKRERCRHTLLEIDHSGESKNINTARSILVQGSGTLFNRRARCIHVVHKEEALSLCQGGSMHPKGSSDIGATVFSAQLRLGLGRPGAAEQPGINRGIDP